MTHSKRQSDFLCHMKKPLMPNMPALRLFSATACASLLFSASANMTHAADAPVKKKWISIFNENRETATLIFSVGTNIDMKIHANSVMPISDGIAANGAAEILVDDGTKKFTLVGERIEVHEEVLSAEKYRAIIDLTKMGATDQQYRKLDGIKGNTGSGPSLSQEEIDRQNSKRLADIIDRFGWPGRRFAGAEVALNAFLVLQHSDTAMQKKYFPLLRDAMLRGEANPGDVALLEDRLRVSEGRPQLYGTQLKSVHPLALYPIEDETNVDARRQKAGLPKLSEYLEMFKSLDTGSK